MFLIAFIIGLSACRKNNDAPTVKLKSNLNITNASADTVNFYLNGTRLNNTSSLYPATSSNYLSNVTVGQQNFQIKKMFNPASSIVQPLFTIPLTLDTGKYYSLFVGGETVDNAFLVLDFTTASLTTLGHNTQTGDTAQTTSYVRFVNASPSAGNLDIAVGDTVKFTNMAFKSAGDFTLVNSGSKTIYAYVHGSATPIAKWQVLMAAGNIYTLYSMGALNGTGNSAFNIGVTLNGN